MAHIVHEPTGSHMQREPNCQPDEGQQTGGQPATPNRLFASSPLCLPLGRPPGCAPPSWAVMRENNGQVDSPARPGVQGGL
jgi:hypothetical protein